MAFLTDSGPWRALRAAAASALFSAVLAGLVGEAFVRVTRSDLHPDRVREHSLEYAPALFARHALPQVEQEVAPRPGESAASRIGPRGYRGRDFAVPKPPGITRVVVLGGSAAFDPRAAPGQDWPHRVERRLRATGRSEVEVINAGTPGHASWDSLGRFVSELWMFEPDWVLVYHSWNDIKAFPWLAPERSLLRGMAPPPTRPDGQRIWNPFIDFAGPLDRALAHSQLYLRLRNRYWEWQLGRIGPEGLVGIGRDEARARRRGEGLPETFSAWGPRQLALDVRAISAAARHAGARTAVLTQARLVSARNDPTDRDRLNLEYLRLSHAGAVRAFEACDEALTTVAVEEGLPLLDLATLSGRGALFEDHVHLSAAGSEAVAEEVSRFLDALLGDSA